MTGWGLFRALHVALGAFWAGTLFFFVLFLEPSIRATGPSGGQVMQALVQRRFLQKLLGIGALTLLSGVVAFWRVSAGFSAAIFAMPYTHVLLTGAVTGVIALGIGFFVSRPTLKRLSAKAANVAASGAPPSDADAAEMAALQGRLRTAARVAAGLLLLSLLFMSMAGEV